MSVYGNYIDTINESILINQEDIYYNKDKFDSGEINLCFITGHSGSGKSTMGRDMQKDNIEHYELDDLQCVKDYFTMENLKEYGDLIYSYFKGPGKRFYVSFDELKERKTPGSEYEDILYKDFVHYAMKYSKIHKNKKFVIEGIWLFCIGEDKKYWFNPEEFKDYAFYIKGTSMIISKYRGTKRDINNIKDNKVILRFTKNFFIKRWKWYLINEKRIKVFRDYFKNILTESTSCSSKYERPYTYKQIVDNYGKSVADKLMKDPAHKWRAETGIELIHKEPTIQELNRIWKNWNYMSDDMKNKSDKKSLELFKLNNKDNFNKLKKEY